MYVCNEVWALDQVNALTCGVVLTTWKKTRVSVGRSTH